MSKERASIPILGIDERPNERQTTPGLASEIKNLKPTGLTEEPEWEPVDHPDQLRNEAGTAYTPGNDAVKTYWHVRGRIGKNGDENGSLRRLLVITNTGIVKVIDPDFGLGWAEVVSKQITSTDAGDWDMHLSQMYDLGYITVTKGGIPQQDLIMEDDLLLDFDFPELPVIRGFVTASEESYTEAQLEAGSHEGLKPPSEEYYGNTGSRYKYGEMAIRFAYRLGSGALVKHSLPEIIRVYQDEVQTDGNYVTSFLNFFFEGFSVAPDNFEFWKNHIRGVSILCTPLYKDGEIERELESSPWYEMDRFNFIDTAEVDEEDHYLQYKGNEEDIMSLQTADVDDNTHHKKLHGPGISYNSRLIFGRERIDFTTPFVSAKELTDDFKVFVDSTGFRESDHVGGVTFVPISRYDLRTVNFTIQNETNCTAEVAGNLRRINVTSPSPTSPWSFEIVFNGTTILLSKSTTTTFKDKFTNDAVASFTATKTIRMEVDIETDAGNYTRVSEDIVINVDGLGYWPSLSLISYPDIRAKKMRIYIKDTGSYYLAQSIGLQSCQKANFSYLNKRIGKSSSGRNHLISLDQGALTAIDAGVNDDKEYIRNKVVVSDVNQALSFESDLVYVIGRSDKVITGFAVNALSMSEGQYGQYPLYVFKEEAIYALEQSQGADVVFGRITPVDISMGIEDEKFAINVGQQIVFSNQSGIYFLQGSDSQKISDPIQSVLASIQAIAYLRSDNDEELLVSTGQTIYRYSMKYGRWYTTEAAENYEHFFTDNENLYGLSASYADGGSTVDAFVTDFQSPDGQPITWKAVLDPIHFGLPDILKRFYLFYLRATITGTLSAFKVLFEGKTFNAQDSQGNAVQKLLPKWKSVYDCAIEISGTGTKDNTKIHKIDTEFKVRYPRKQRS